MKFCNIAKFEITWKIDEEFKLTCQIIFKLCVFVIVYLSTHRQTHVNNQMLIYDRTPEEEQVFTITVRIYIYVMDINLHGRRLTLQRHGKQQKLSVLIFVRHQCEGYLYCVYTKVLLYSLIHIHEVCLMLL